MESDKFIIETDVLEILAKKGMDASRKEVLMRIQKVQEEILEHCLASNREPPCAISLNNTENTRPHVPNEALVWLKDNWEAAMLEICRAVVPQNLVTENAVLIYDRCISAILMAVGVLFEGPIAATQITISHLGKALSILINRTIIEGQETPMFTLGVFSETVCSVIMRILKVSNESVVGDNNCISDHQLHPLKEYHMHLKKYPPHSLSFITRADDSYGALYKLVEWGNASPTLLTAVCSNIYLSLCENNNCV